MAGTEDVAYVVSASDLLTGFSDVDGDTLVVANLTSSSGTVTNNGNGTFTISAPANVNGIVTLTYDVSDGNGGSVTGQTRTFTRAAVNDAPTTVSLSALTVAEYAANGTAVGSLSAIDGDSAGPFTFTIVSQSVAGTFVIDGGTLKVADFSKLDFEQASLKTHTVTVRADDGAGGQLDRSFTITATDRTPENVSGTAGNDAFIGGAGNDILNGNAGNDILSGGGGTDALYGGLGRDIMTGGALSDRFDFNFISHTGKTAATRDIITDFQHLVDDIDLSTIDANGSAAGSTAFSFLATAGAAFTGVKGQLHWFQINAAGIAADKTIIEGDANGDKIADFQIELTGLKTLSAADFIL